MKRKLHCNNGTDDLVVRASQNTSPVVHGLKLLSGPIVDSVFNPSKVDHMNNRNSWGGSG